jgi:hypothetical protein
VAISFEIIRSQSHPPDYDASRRRVSTETPGFAADPNFSLESPSRLLASASQLAEDKSSQHSALHQGCFGAAIAK